MTGEPRRSEPHVPFPERVWIAYPPSSLPPHLFSRSPDSFPAPCIGSNSSIPHSSRVSTFSPSRRRRHQIRALTSAGRTIASPSLHPHAALNSGMLLNGPFTRHIDGV